VLGRGELEISVRFRPVGPAPAPPPLDVTAPIAGAWIPAAGLRPGARVDVGAMVGTIAGEPIESKVAGIVVRLLVDAETPVTRGQPLLELAS
jgi:biotin carboxyl carrier protein